MTAVVSTGERMTTRTRWSLVAACSILVLTSTGCVVSPSSVAMTSPSDAIATPASEPDAASPDDVAAPDLCDTSTAETIALLDAALDRIDRATSSDEIDAASQSMSELFSQAGTDMGQHCGLERVGEAASELIVWASSAASSRPPVSASFAEGFLGSVCELDVELGVDFTPPAQVACAG
ncbi:hypothetical protein [Agrococcus jejuensis]|uniref:Uncharacterized protein n=1 Tax=Agrococcus jejuensis TaxID=399736 RepID=A0A1G8GXJ4_9MICO|nr:hypothetical protein [Agrococcus jejuensis]SDH99084.1 hypothetical protein SAMN04489720_3114 [Agrococcus jejuensis]